MLTSDYVLDEAYTLLRMRLGVGPVRRLHDLFSRSSSLQILRVPDRDSDHALEFMLSHEDKKWGLTDCTSFVLMRELDVSSSFTFDQNFEEAGFRMLPGRPPDRSESPVAARKGEEGL